MPRFDAPTPCNPSRRSKANIRSGRATSKRTASSRCAKSSGSASSPSVPLGAGFLTGKIDAMTELGPGDFRSFSPRFTLEARSANSALVDLSKRVAARKQATPAQIALGWLLAQQP